MTGMCAAAQNRLPEALRDLRKGASLAGGDPYFMARLGDALARSGDRAAARQVSAELERRSQTEFVPHINLAWPYIGLGDLSRALDHLEQAAAGRETDLLFLRVEPIYDPLRADPRFHAILRQAGLDGVHL